MLRSAVRLQIGVKREWEVASNTTWTYVRFHWDLLALSRSAEGSTIHFFSHVDWAAVGYKKEQQQPTSWSRLSTFRRNGKFHNYSKVSLWAEMIQAIIKLLRWKLWRTDDDGKTKNWSAIDMNYVNRKLNIADAYNYRMFSDAEGLFFRCECCGSAQLPQ